MAAVTRRLEGAFLNRTYRYFVPIILQVCQVLKKNLLNKVLISD